MSVTLSIVVPAFNEESRLGSSVKSILRYLEGNYPDSELIIVDDGSTDKTSQIAENACENFPHMETRVIRYERNRGKGFAVRTGLEPPPAC